MSIELPFDPFPLLPGSHQQTIVGTFLNWHSEPESEQRLITLPDGDKISLEITTPPNWSPYKPTLIMLHGLCGSHRSTYLIRMTKRLSALGLRCIRFNMRGCGSGKGHAKQIYHSGRSDDVWQVIKILSLEHALSPYILVGFSLGGHIVLKMAGELGALAEVIIEQVIAISPPCDLHQSVTMLSTTHNAIYESYFLRLLKANVKYRHILHNLPPVEWPEKMCFMDFDEVYTAPQSGFESAMDYYTKCSSVGLVPEIQVPCRILFAEDDPIVSPHNLDGITFPDNVKLYKTKKGGHMGYLAMPNRERGFRWMDQVLEEWILDPHHKNS